jgi:Lipid A 3-O-deacylase (PagL)
VRIGFLRIKYVLSFSKIHKNQILAGIPSGSSITFHAFRAAVLSSALALSSGSIALWSQAGVSGQPMQATAADSPLDGDKSEALPDAPTPASSAAEARGQDGLVAGLASVSPAVERLPLNTTAFSSNLDTLNFSSPDLAEPIAGTAAARPAGAYVPLDQCPFDETHARECRVHIKPLVISASLFLTFENAGNLYTGYWYRYETATGKWWDRYVNSVDDWRWDRWSDNNPFLDDYVGHPMMGAITDQIWIQNDPKGMTLEQSNTWPYWRSRMRALAFSTFYSFEWKLGPIGEASIGHNGDHFYEDQGSITNETGWVELVTTPVGGLAWTLAEDALDKHVVKRLEEHNRNPILLTVYQFLTPARGFDNILRFRPPWYRDSRIVKANSFFSDPGEGITATTYQAMKDARRDPRAEAYLASLGEAGRLDRPVEPHVDWEGPGGKHEFGALWGLSLMSGHVFGYAADVKYMPITLRYSYELYRHHEQWTLRYAPEGTPLAMIDWPTPTTVGKQPAILFDQRTRAYGEGLSPVGFEMDAKPLSRVQPFFRTNGGFIYFDKRVLSPEGSRFMYTIGPDIGLNIYRHKRQAVTIGWRYTHLSNANISEHNPGTDANVFYVGVSRFRTKGE